MEVRSSGSLSLENYGPAVVHCSAGIGRSGTFCLVDSCLVMVRVLMIHVQVSLPDILSPLPQVEKNQDSAKVKVQDVLLEMRKYRSGLIQTRDQLRFAYRAIIHGAKDILNVNTNEEEVHLNDEDNLPLVKSSREVRRNDNDPSKGTSESPPAPAEGSTSNNNLTPATELRKRLREEKNRKMNEKIKSIKEKQKESESRLRTKNVLLKVGIFSLGLIATASLVYYFWPPSPEVLDPLDTVPSPSTVELHATEENLVQLIKDNVSLPGSNLPRASGS